MKALSFAFAILKTTSNAVNFDPELRGAAAEVYEAYRKSYVIAADRYSNAAACALIDALECDVQCAKEGFEVWLLELQAVNPKVTDPTSTTAKAKKLKQESSDRAAKAKSLQIKAKIAEVDAEGYMALVESIKNAASPSK
jgi:hypothetical protein